MTIRVVDVTCAVQDMNLLACWLSCRVVSFSRHHCVWTRQGDNEDLESVAAIAYVSHGTKPGALRGQHSQRPIALLVSDQAKQNPLVNFRGSAPDALDYPIMTRRKILN